jgi:carbon-monoxide dehydrogenase large subunit
MSESVDSWVGKSIKRKEDVRLIRGQGQYLSDMVVPRMLHLGFVHSIHAHARIKSIDTSQAARMPGVVAVITGQEFKDWSSVLTDVSIPNLPGQTKRPLYWPLPPDKVYHVGEPVVAVVARYKYLLEDAMELVDIDYEPLPVVIDSEEALRPGAPLLYPEWGDNVIYHQHIQGGDAQRGFAEADLVISERFVCHRTGAQPMETRGMLATYDEGEGLTLWLTTQRPHNIRDLLASYMQLPHDRVRVIQPRDVGSAFGSKAPFYREEIVASHLAMKLRQPVRWIENRMESLMNVGQERDQIHYVDVALRKDGTLLAVRDRIIANCGDGQIGIYAGFAMPHLGAMYLVNGNDVAAVDIDLTCVVTNEASLTPVRAFGSYPGRFALDRILDIAGRRLGIDPLEMRKRNASGFPILPLWACTSTAAISLVPWTRRPPLWATRPFAPNRPGSANTAAIWEWDSAWEWSYRGCPPRCWWKWRTRRATALPRSISTRRARSTSPRATRRTARAMKPPSPRRWPASWD